MLELFTRVLPQGERESKRDWAVRIRQKGDAKGYRFTLEALAVAVGLGAYGGHYLAKHPFFLAFDLSVEEKAALAETVKQHPRQETGKKREDNLHYARRLQKANTGLSLEAVCVGADLRLNIASLDPILRPFALSSDQEKRLNAALSKVHCKHNIDKALMLQAIDSVLTFEAIANACGVVPPRLHEKLCPAGEHAAEEQRVQDAIQGAEMTLDTVASLSRVFEADRIKGPHSRPLHLGYLAKHLGLEIDQIKEALARAPRTRRREPRASARSSA